MQEEAEHLDRQPPRHEAEAAEQDRLIAEPADDTSTELPTEASAVDVRDDGGDSE